MFLPQNSTFYFFGGFGEHTWLYSELIPGSMLPLQTSGDLMRYEGLNSDWPHSRKTHYLPPPHLLFKIALSHISYKWEGYSFHISSRTPPLSLLSSSLPLPLYHLNENSWKREIAKWVENHINGKLIWFFFFQKVIQWKILMKILMDQGDCAKGWNAWFAWRNLGSVLGTTTGVTPPHSAGSSSWALLGMKEKEREKITFSKIHL